nr:MAG TPA: hypothetical protein [Caudoviricetes sp.]
MVFMTYIWEKEENLLMRLSRFRKKMKMEINSG